MMQSQHQDRENESHEHGWSRVSCVDIRWPTRLEQVTSFLYLGLTITEDTECEADILAQLNKAHAIIRKLMNLWKFHDLARGRSDYGTILCVLLSPIDRR